MSYIKINNDYLRTPEYIKFNKATKSTTFFFVLSSVIRKSTDVKNRSHGAHYIYNEHYLKGELVGRYSQVDMAHYLNTSQSRISAYINELEQDGFIKTIKRTISKGEINYYQVGVWDGVCDQDSYKETLWFDIIFKGYTEIAKHKRREYKQIKIQTMIEMVEDMKVKNYKGPLIV